MSSYEQPAALHDQPVVPMAGSQPVVQPMFVALSQQPLVAPTGQFIIGQSVAAPSQPVCVQYVHVPQAGGDGGIVFMPHHQVNAPQAPQAIDRRLLPSHHLILATLVTMLCAFFNLSSLVFGIPAWLCAYTAYYEKRSERYANVKSYGNAAAVLSIVNLVYTGVVTLFIIGVTFGIPCTAAVRC